MSPSGIFPNVTSLDVMRGRGEASEVLELGYSTPIFFTKGGRIINYEMEGISRKLKGHRPPVTTSPRMMISIVLCILCVFEICVVGMNLIRRR